MEKKTISLRRRQLLQAAAVAGSLPFLATAARNAAAQATTNAPDTIGSGPVRVAVLDDFMRLAMDAADWKALSNRATIDFYHEPFRDQAVLARQMAPYEAIVIARHGQAFTADTISKLPKLKFLSNQGGTTYRLDMPQLEKQKVVISGGDRSRSEGPTGNVEEIAFALLIDLARQVSWHNADMHAGRPWQFRPSPQLAGKTLGLVGLGLVGGKMVQFAKAFNMKTVAWSLNLTDEQAQKAGSTRVDLEDLLAQSDFVSIHYRLGERSRNLLRAEHFAQMKPTAYVINTSRGPILNEPDLITALQKKQIAGAALDVFESEPLALDHPFRSMDNVILTPHIGYVTAEYVTSAWRQAHENVVAFLDGKPIRVQGYEGVAEE
jgi:phosphoglycerate dehydrogenase-like enzyme